ISQPNGVFSASAGGVVAYQIGTSAGPQLLWLDRAGKPVGNVMSDGMDYGDLTLAPDMQRAAVRLFDSTRKTRDIWLVDLVRGIRTRFTIDPAEDAAPLWSPDGARLVFASNRRGHFDLYEKAASGIVDDAVLMADDRDKIPLSWSPDGRFILYMT